jgi:hypothetical protein
VHRTRPVHCRRHHPHRRRSRWWLGKQGTLDREPDELYKATRRRESWDSLMVSADNAAQAKIVSAPMNPKSVSEFVEASRHPELCRQGKTRCAESGRLVDTSVRPVAPWNGRAQVCTLTICSVTARARGQTFALLLNRSAHPDHSSHRDRYVHADRKQRKCRPPPQARPTFCSRCASELKRKPRI